MSELHHQSIQTGAEAGKKNSLQAEHNQIPTPPLSLLQAMSTSSSLSSTRSTEMLRRGENSALQAQLNQATAKIAELKSKMEKFEEEILSTTRTVLGGCPACFLILKGVVISSHETNRFS